MPKLYFVFFLLFWSFNSVASWQRDTVIKTQSSPVKTISAGQYKAYTDGVDLHGMAAVAELNHFPSPDSVMVLKKEIGLTTEQLMKIKSISLELKHKMKEMGGFIIKNEKMLDTLFSSHKIDDGSLIFYTNRYGLYQGEMRNAVLQAYFKTYSILTPLQIERYQKLQKP